MSLGCKTYRTIFFLPVGRFSVEVLHLVRADDPRKHSSADQRLEKE